MAEVVSRVRDGYAGLLCRSCVLTRLAILLICGVEAGLASLGVALYDC